MDCILRDYIEYIIKMRKTLSNNPKVKLYINKSENRITLKIKAGHYQISYF